MFGYASEENSPQILHKGILSSKVFNKFGPKLMSSYFLFKKSLDLETFVEMDEP